MIDEVINPGYLRPESREALAAALAWGSPRMNSPAVRALFMALNGLLQGFNATVMPVEHSAGTGPEIDFRVTLSRLNDEGRPVRQRFAITSQPDAASAIAEKLEIVSVDASECSASPWIAAGRITGAMLQRLRDLRDVA